MANFVGEFGVACTGRSCEDSTFAGVTVQRRVSSARCHAVHSMTTKRAPAMASAMPMNASQRAPALEDVSLF